MITNEHGADQPTPGRDQLALQVKQQLDSLRAAGVEWLPRAGAARPESSKGVAVTTADASRPSQNLSAFHPDEMAPTAIAEEMPAPIPAAVEPESIDTRRLGLKVLSEEVAGCRRCPELAATRTQTVFGIGSIPVELCLIGEAPGADEDAQGEPFVGAAGQLLNRILAACGLKREEVYICNTLKCRPPGNRTPTANELDNCHGYLEKQIELVKPKFICLLGGSAVKSMFGANATLGRMRKRFHDYRGIPVMCTYHPAYLLPHRHPESKRDVWEDMKMLMARMGRPVA